MIIRASSVCIGTRQIDSVGQSPPMRAQHVDPSVCRCDLVYQSKECQRISDGNARAVIILGKDAS